MSLTFKRLSLCQTPIKKKKKSARRTDTCKSAVRKCWIPPRWHRGVDPHSPCKEFEVRGRRGNETWRRRVFGQVSGEDAKPSGQRVTARAAVTSCWLGLDRWDNQQPEARTGSSALSASCVRGKLFTTSQTWTNFYPPLKVVPPLGIFFSSIVETTTSG